MTTTLPHFSLKLKLKPVPKARPRSGKNGTYTPKRTVDYENAIRKAFCEKYPTHEPLDGPVTLVMDFEPDRISVDIYPSLAVKSKLRGDLDNYVKAVGDALNGLAYNDDKQVQRIEAFK